MGTLKFEEKMSGTRVTGFECKPLFKDNWVEIHEVLEKVHTQEAMDWILDNIRFSKGSKEGLWWATMDYDTQFKLDIIENHPDELAQLKEYFGENWMEHYIRFNH